MTAPSQLKCQVTVLSGDNQFQTMSEEGGGGSPDIKNFAYQTLKSQ